MEVCLGIYMEKISANTVIGGVRMLIGPRDLKSLNSIEKIQPRMMVATFNDNHSTTIISCYRPTNVSEETNLIIFFNELVSLVCSSRNTTFSSLVGLECPNLVNKKLSLRNMSNGNGEHLTDFKQ